MWPRSVRDRGVVALAYSPHSLAVHDADACSRRMPFRRCMHAHVEKTCATPSHACSPHACRPSRMPCCVSILMRAMVRVRRDAVARSLRKRLKKKKLHVGRLKLASHYPTGVRIGRDWWDGGSAASRTGCPFDIWAGQSTKWARRDVISQNWPCFLWGMTEPAPSFLWTELSMELSGGDDEKRTRTDEHAQVQDR